MHRSVDRETPNRSTPRQGRDTGFREKDSFTFSQNSVAPLTELSAERPRNWAYQPVVYPVPERERRSRDTGASSDIEMNKLPIQKMGTRDSSVDSGCGRLRGHDRQSSSVSRHVPVAELYA